MKNAIVHLGSNLGDRHANLKKGVDLLEAHVKILDKSHIYCTAAWGVSDQSDFYNQALSISCIHSAQQLLDICLKVGLAFPEKVGERWGPRYLDIDIIFFGEDVLDSDRLKIPHPRMHLRNFVLIPLLEIVPDWVHPELNKTVEELYKESTDNLEVILLEAH